MVISQLDVMNVNAEHMKMNDDLLIIYLLGEASAQQAAQVDKWRAVDPANEHHFEQFRIIWETSKELKFDGENDAYASLQRLKQKALQQKPKQVKIFNFYRSHTWLKVAAAIILIAAGVWTYTYKFSVKQVQFATQEIVKTDILSDGSVITLNKHSIIQYPERFTGKQRNVILTKGEAFFNVSHNKAMPFLISTGGTTIKVVGTSFNVKNKYGDVEVIVESGIVQVSKKGIMVSLKPGEKVLIGRNTSEAIKEKNPDQLYNYYRSKEFIANDTPLWRIVQVLNEAYDSHIVIGNKNLNDLPLNTTFKDESLDDVLQVISRTFKITVERKDNQIILK